MMAIAGSSRGKTRRWWPTSNETRKWVSVSRVKPGIFGVRPFFIAIEGQAELIRDKGAFAEHWSKDLDHWFEQGVDTPGLVLIQVHAKNVHYWDGEEEGEVQIEHGPS